MTAQPTAPTAAAAADSMRAARRRWAGGVAVALTRDEEGDHGSTVGSFAVLSLDPPLVIVCFDRDGRMASLVPDHGSFAVSILDRRHEFLADRFAGRAPLPDRLLTGIPHERTPSGNARLAGVLAWFDCRVSQVHGGGDHVVVVAAVTAVSVGADTDDPLLYYEGRYRSIEAG